MSSTQNGKVEEADSNPLGLDEVELKCLSSQIDLPPSKAGYLTIYRCANRVDVLVIAFSAVMASGAGATLPLMTVPSMNLRFVI